MIDLLETPKIDIRSLDDIVLRLRKLILSNTRAWSSMEALENDEQANAFIHAYANMMLVMTERLNKLPDKNYIAFLNMLGVEQIPPKAATVPVTFDLLGKSPRQLIIVPKGTQVAAEKTADNKPVVFETKEDFTIIRPNLENAYNIDGLIDRWSQIPEDIFRVEESADVTLFRGNELIPHRLYIGDDQAFGFDTPTEIIIYIELENNVNEFEYKGKIKWYCYIRDMDEPVELKVKRAAETEKILKKKRFDEADYLVEKEIMSFTRSGYIQFEPVYHTIEEKEISGIVEFTDESNTSLKKYEERTWENNFIYAELESPISKLQLKNDNSDTTVLKQNYDFPVIKNVKIAVKPQEASEDKAPDILFKNNYTLDHSKAFYPFGERPAFNDTLYIGSKDVFSKEGSTVTITFKKAENITPQTNGVHFLWEYFDGSLWQKLGESANIDINNDPDYGNEAHNFNDETMGFTWSDPDKDTKISEVTFSCPEIVTTAISGKENYYIRVRIKDGNYSSVEEKKVGATNGKEVISNVTVHHPPVVESVTISYQSAPLNKVPEQILAYNNFLYNDLRGETLTSFVPFKASREKSNTLYFYFSENVAYLPVNLFFSLANSDDEALHLIAARESIGVVLEYWNGEEWQPVNYEDKTDRLTQRGALFFYAPSDMQATIRFGEEKYWMRICYQKGDSRYFPKIDGLYINTIWCDQLISVNNELLGSSNGLANQVFTFANGPVLAGQKIYVLNNALTVEDIDHLRSHEGHDAVIEVFNKANNKNDYWVLWHEKPHFYYSDAQSRHYIINRSDNTIKFGDGKKGTIPPVGRNNIKAVFYQFGGGEAGNVKKGDISKLRSSIPYVGSIFNIIPSYGGRDLETVEQIQQRGADAIKFNKRTVTTDDFESISAVFPADIARIKAIPNRDIFGKFQPGYITLLLLANSDEKKPLVDLTVLQEVTSYINERSLGFITQTGIDQINVITPKFVRINVQAEVIITGEVHNVGKLNFIENNVAERLRNFFHPVTGGQKSNGWEFGEIVPVSEVISEIEQTEGVDAVKKVTIKPSLQQALIQYGNEAGDIAPFTAGSPYPYHSQVRIGRAQQYLLIDEITEGQLVDKMTVTGFCEEDEVIIKYTNDLGETDEVNLKIAAVDYNKIRFEAADVLEEFPIGSSIETFDGSVKSYLTSALKQNLFGSYNVGDPLEVEVAVPNQEKVYHFTDDFEDDSYSETWDSTFVPLDLPEFEGFSEPEEFDTYPVYKGKEPQVITVDENRFIILYHVQIGNRKVLRVRMGQKNIVNGDIDITYSAPQTVSLGSRRVTRHYYVWVRYRRYYWYRSWYNYGHGYYYSYRPYSYGYRHYSYRTYGYYRTYRYYGSRNRYRVYSVNRYYNNYYRDYYYRYHYYWYYWVRQRRTYYDYIPIEMGYVSMVNLGADTFAVSFSDARNNHSGHVFIGDYSAFGTTDIDDTAKKFVIGPRVSFASQAQYIVTKAVKGTVTTDSQLLIAFRGASGSRLHVYVAGIKQNSNATFYYCTIKHSHYKDMKQSDNKTALMLTLSAIEEIRTNRYCIAIKGNDGLGYLQAITFSSTTSDTKITFDNDYPAIHYNVKGDEDTFIPENVTSILEINLQAMKNHEKFSIPCITVVYIRKDTLTGKHVGEATIFEDTGSLSQKLPPETFSSSTNMSGLKTGIQSWIYEYGTGDKVSKKSCMLIGYRDIANNNRPTVVRMEIESVDTMDFNQPVVVHTNSVNYFIPVMFDHLPGTGQTVRNSTLQDPVKICSVIVSKYQGYCHIGSELSLFGRALPEEERFLLEKNGYLTLDTGVAFENTPRRFYTINTKMHFEPQPFDVPQPFEITMEALLGTNVEANYSLFIALVDDVISLQEMNAIPGTGIQLRIDRLFKDDVIELKDEDESTFEGDDLTIQEKVTLMKGKGESDSDDEVKINKLVADGSFVPGMNLVFKLAYDGIGHLKGSVQGRNDNSDIFAETVEMYNVIINRNMRLVAGVANIMDLNKDDDGNIVNGQDDVETKSRAEMYITNITSTLVIRPFEDLKENRITLVNANDADVTENHPKGNTFNNITSDLNDMNQVYLNEHNLIYSGTHSIDASTEDSDASAAKQGGE